MPTALTADAISNKALYVTFYQQCSSMHVNLFHRNRTVKTHTLKETLNSLAKISKLVRHESMKMTERNASTKTQIFTELYEIYIFTPTVALASADSSMVNKIDHGITELYENQIHGSVLQCHQTVGQELYMETIIYR